MGVGQGRALSPVLSALYISLLMKLFNKQVEHLGVMLLSYVDDSTIITQAPNWDSNCVALWKVYGIIFHLFERFTLELKHNKSKLFHFSQKYNNNNPLLDSAERKYVKDSLVKGKKHLNSPELYSTPSTPDEHWTNTR